MLEWLQKHLGYPFGVEGCSTSQDVSHRESRGNRLPEHLGYTSSAAHRMETISYTFCNTLEHRHLLAIQPSPSGQEIDSCGTSLSLPNSKTRQVEDERLFHAGPLNKLLGHALIVMRQLTEEIEQLDMGHPKMTNQKGEPHHH